MASAKKRLIPYLAEKEISERETNSSDEDFSCSESSYSPSNEYSSESDMVSPEYFIFKNNNFVA